MVKKKKNKKKTRVLYKKQTNKQKKTCTTVFITAARTWKQPKCPLSNEWIKKTGTYIQWNITQA